jgi:hypothetical protein
MASIVDTERFRGKVAASQGTGGDGGGTVDDMTKRLGVLESSVAEIRVNVGTINTTLPHLATQASLNDVKAALPHLATQASLNAVTAVLPHVATQANLNAVEGSIMQRMSALEVSIIKWVVGTALSSVATGAGIAFAIAKFVK